MTDIDWIGVDLDGTLAYYDGWRGPEHIGAPIPQMLDRVKQWLREGYEVRIFTARAATLEQIPPVQKWCEQHLGKVLPVTCVKDQYCIEIWDDRAVQVIPNMGLRADGKVTASFRPPPRLLAKDLLV